MVDSTPAQICEIHGAMLRYSNAIFDTPKGAVEKQIWRCVNGLIVKEKDAPDSPVNYLEVRRCERLIEVLRVVKSDD